MWQEWHWNWFPPHEWCSATILPRAIPSCRDTAFSSIPALVWDVICRATPRLWTKMSTYYNGSLNGFWIGYSDMRPRSTALAGPKPIFWQGCRDHGPHCKAGVQGPNRFGSPMSYIYIYIKKKKKVRLIIIIIILCNWNMVIGWKFMIEAMGKGSFFLWCFWGFR